MNIVIYGSVMKRDVFTDVFSEDIIVGKWDLSDVKLNIDMLLHDESTCVLLLDGDYQEMLATCLSNGIPIIRILNVERYIAYKKIENELSKVGNVSWNYICCLYNGYQKIIKLYEYDNQVIGACKKDFIRKVSMMANKLF